MTYWLSGLLLQEDSRLQSFYPERFERVIWITEEEWLRCLPDAIGDYFSKLHANSAGVRIDEGALGLTWEVALPKKNGFN